MQTKQQNVVIYPVSTMDCMYSLIFTRIDCNCVPLLFRWKTKTHARVMVSVFRICNSPHLFGFVNIWKIHVHIFILTVQYICFGLWIKIPQIHIFPFLEPHVEGNAIRVRIMLLPCVSNHV